MPVLGVVPVSLVFHLVFCRVVDRGTARAMLAPVVGVVALGGEGGDAGGAGSSRGTAPSYPYGKDSAAPQPWAPKCTADPVRAGRLAKRKRGTGHGRPSPVPVLTG